METNFSQRDRKGENGEIFVHVEAVPVLSTSSGRNQAGKERQGPRSIVPRTLGVILTNSSVQPIRRERRR
ncbi:hypothetical protein CKO32_14650 [Afifella marina DSM 2698]|nr:hypothetical protein [Afifella marina DSM 2698]MBK1628615.1 hypothetical protein [Afifella marina]MBK5915974.1 hypothetical protein [Afifella marina]RAI20496.1 hypothetical protein CH311_08820 [Afifella marina DSM 2698]